VLVELGVPVHTVALVLAQAPPGKGEEFGEASPIALVVIVLLGLATVVLIRSMTRRLKKLPASFDRSDDATGTPDAAPSDAGPSDAGPSDAGPSDTAPSDAAPSDAAPSDVGRSDVGRSDVAADRRDVPGDA
jgi:hypothetical protein